MLDRAEAASLTPYQPYGGQRLAGTNADITGSRKMIENIAGQGMPATSEAMDMTRNAAAGVNDIAGRGPYQYSQFDYSGPGQFDSAAAQQYMSPYIQNVLNLQKEQANRDFQIQNAGRGAQAVQAGAFGGSRQAVQQGMAENDLLNRQNMTQATGLQSAYSDAQRMFEADRQARMANEQSRAAELSRVQSGQAGENYNRDRLGLEGLQFQNQSAQQLSALESRARAGDIQAAQLLEAAGKGQQAQEQAGLDIGYQTYQNQQQYPWQQIQNYSGILQGLPIANAGTTTTTGTAAQPSGLQQLMGAGNLGPRPLQCVAVNHGNEHRSASGQPQEPVGSAARASGANAFTGYAAVPCRVRIEPPQEDAR